MTYDPAPRHEFESNLSRPDAGAASGTAGGPGERYRACAARARVANGRRFPAALIATARNLVEADGAGGLSHDSTRVKKAQRSGFLEALALVCVAFALALVLKTYVAEAYEIKGRSMEPTFASGQRVVVLKSLYSLDRGDVIVFTSTEDGSKDLIKRVIGTPGDTVRISSEGTVYVNGEPLAEEYVEHAGGRRGYGKAYPVPPGHYYVLGDNRPDSHDSRFFRAIPMENIKGKVLLRWWPFADFRLFAP